MYQHVAQKREETRSLAVLVLVGLTGRGECDKTERDKVYSRWIERCPGRQNCQNDGNLFINQ